MPELTKQNILLLIPNLGPGGAQRVFHDHSIALSERYNVIECVFNTDDGLAYPTTNELINLKVPAGSNVFFKFYYFLLRCSRLRKIKQKYRISVCISHLEGADYVNILSKGSAKVVLCIHGSKVHDSNISGGLGLIRKKILMPNLYNRADKIITVSKDIGTELVKNYGVLPGKIQTINNFFELDNIQEKACQPLPLQYQKIFASWPVIITSGRLTAQKNQAPLLLVFSKLLHLQSSKLVILGDGDLRESLILYSKQLGLKTYTIWDTPDNFNPADFDVYFLGYQGNPFQYLKQATIFAFPSAWEGFPMALCEAMVCGLPVISTDCPTGPREILAPDTILDKSLKQEEYAAYGVLMPLLDKTPNSSSLVVWINTLKNFINDSDKLSSYTKKGIIRVQDFTPGKIVAQWQAVIDER